jgi:hypothetical protein
MARPIRKKLLATLVISTALIAPASAYFTPRCVGAHGLNLTDLGGGNMEWCLPPGKAGNLSEAPALWAAYNKRHAKHPAQSRTKSAERSQVAKPSTKSAEQPQAAKPHVATQSPSTQVQGGCSDITGVGGASSGPCPQNGGIPPKVQAQMDQAQPTPQQAAKTPSGVSAVQAAIKELREAEAAFRAAGDLAAAGAAVEQIQKLEDMAQKSACPPLGPATYWVDKPDVAGYCASANCFDRGTAYYGMKCFPEHKNVYWTKDERKKLCQEALAKLQPLVADHDRDWLVDEMKRSSPPCDVDGNPKSRL